MPDLESLSILCKINAQDFRIIDNLAELNETGDFS